MTTAEMEYISSSLSETYQSLGFSVLFYTATFRQDKYSQKKVALVPATAVVYAVYANEKTKDADLATQQDLGDVADFATLKVVVDDLTAVGITRLKRHDVAEITIQGELKKYIVTGFSDKNELPNIVIKPKLVLMSDVNVREYYG